MRCILLISSYLFLCCAHVHAIDITEQLETIKQQEDKAVAINELDKLLNNGLSSQQRIKVLILQAGNYLSLGDLPKALLTSQQAKHIAQQKRFLSLQAQADKLIGVISYYQGKYEQAYTAYQAALTYFQKQSLSDEVAIKQANLLNNIALVQTAQGRAIAALNSYQQAEPLYQRYGSEMDKIDVRYNLATLYISLRRFDIAISMLEDVIVRRTEVGDDYGVAKATGDLGISFRYSGQYQKAELNILNALAYFQQHQLFFDEASQLHNIAEVNFELSQPDKALNYALLGIEVSKKTGHQKAYAGSLQTLAKVYFYQGGIEEARRNVELSNTIAEKMGYQGLIHENLSLMSLIYAADNQTKKALQTQLNYQKAQLKQSNKTLNEQIALFESDQLTQQVSSLQQSKKLQQLELIKAEQQRQLIVLGVILLLVVLFLIYRRYLEHNLNKELDNRVKQRTETLEFLTQELQSANSIKSQFLANMSHEIRTPLTAVIGQAEAIIHGDFDNASTVKEVEVIHSNSLLLLQLINDILDLSKIEANKFELENQKQDLHTIVNKLNDIFTEQAQRKGLSFTITHHLPSPFIIDIDGLRLKQILINLCSNAIKFTSEGWVTLDIAIIDKTLFFTVTDTGIGMSEGQIIKVFNMFTQGDNSISRRFSGSGLGLFLSEQLARVMDGNITVTSQLDHGSSFVFKLPFGEIYATLPNEKIYDNEHITQTQEHTHYTGKILLADDHDDNRRLIARLLMGLGVDVIEASNGVEAVDLCVTYQPEVVLLDIQMPEMDGIQALEKLRELGYKQPIYALTANAMSHEIAQYLSLGFDGHLKKPIERETFLATIAQHYSETIGGAEFGSNTADDIDLTDLVQSFVANLSIDKLAIEQFRQSHNIKSLAREAHKLAGAAKMFGFAELSQTASDLEIAIKNSKEEQVDDLTHCLLDEINSVQHNHSVVSKNDK